MVGTKKTEEEEEAEIVEQDSLMAMKNLLRIAIYNISYIRGIFPEDYFRDDNVPESELIVKKLVPKDVESRRLIDWIEEGVYDAVQKNYAETVLFCICEKDEGATIEEYSFKFRYPDTSHEDAAMEFILTGSRVNGAMFKSNAAESSADQIRRLIRVSATMMSSLNPIPDERTIQMKLMYYDDVTPVDYEPPLFQSCLDEDDDKDLAQLFGRLCCISDRAPILIVDSGATHHICCDKSYFTEIKKIDKEKRIVLYTADGTEVKAKKAGLIEYGSIHLSQIHYIPSVNFNVISIGYLDKQGLLISIANNELFIIDVNKSIHVGEGFRHRKNNDYILKAMNWVVQTEVELQLDELMEDEEDEEEEEENSEMWVVDSGCASHMAGDFAMLSNPKPVDEEFQVPRGRMKATYKGTVSNKNVKLSDVRYCPASKDNLISVGVLDSQGHRFIFYNGVCTIACKETLTEVGRAKIDNSNLLYYLKKIEIRNVISKRKNRRSRRNKA